MDVKVGDKVLVSRGFRWKDSDFIDEVAKVTPTGRVRLKRIDNYQFDKNGNQMGGSRDIWSHSYKISIPTPEDYERIERNKLIDHITYQMSKLNRKDIEILDEKTLQILNLALDCVGTLDDERENKFNQIRDIVNDDTDKEQESEEDIER